MRNRYVTVAIVVFALITAPLLQAKAQAGQTPATQSPIPQWQTDAGGKMAFDAASVKQNSSSAAVPSSNIPLGPMDAFAPTGGLLSTTAMPLDQYLRFAYKLTPSQLSFVAAALPKWATMDRFDIQARAQGNSTKDQFRLMMQDLLAERFKLAVHWETRQAPALALVLAKSGKFGPQLKPHLDNGQDCSTAQTGRNGGLTPVEGGFPEICGVVTPLMEPSVPGLLHWGARNVPLSMLANSITNPNATSVDRPVLDRTGLTGTFDLWIEFAPQGVAAASSDAAAQPDATGPTFLEALQEQLGLKLESTTGPIDVIVIDHVEEPSPN
jgi:uncharacterized protein (TIGR03435 family)